MQVPKTALVQEAKSPGHVIGSQSIVLLVVCLRSPAFARLLMLRLEPNGIIYSATIRACEGQDVWPHSPGP